MKDHKGALLIEALLAVLIISVSLTVIVQALSNNLKAVALTADYARAVLYLGNGTFDDMVRGSVEEDTKKEESCTYLRGDCRWERRTQKAPEPVSDFVPSVNETRYTLSWGSGKKKRDLSIVTYFSDEQDEKL